MLRFVLFLNLPHLELGIVRCANFFKSVGFYSAV